MYLKRFIKNKGWLYGGYYFLGKGKSFHPRDINLEVTYRCNLRCRMCLFYGMGQGEIKNHREELPLSSWQRLIDDVTPWRSHINITGGEPFLREDLVELVRYIKSKGLVGSINTNGVLASPEKLEPLLKLKLEHLTFSLDGSESVHDLIRGQKGAFKKMSEHIHFVIRNRLAWPRVWGICVISRENVDILDRMVYIAKELGLDGMQFQQVMFLDEGRVKLYQDEVKEMGNHADIGLEGLNHGQGELDAELLRRQMKEIKKKGRALKLPVSFLPHLYPSEIGRYYGDLSWTYGHRCLVPWRNVTIAPDGDVFPCLRIKMGNIRDESIHSIWGGENFTRFRQRLRGKGIFTRCLRCCHLGEF